MDNHLDKIINNLVWLKPILFKTLLNPQLVSPGITPGLFFILTILKNEQVISMSEIGKKLMIPKPNVTIFVDKLIELKYVERNKVQKDRRMIVIKLTKKGNDFINKTNKDLKKLMQKKLNILSNEDIILLSQSLEQTKNIILKYQLQFEQKI